MTAKPSDVINERAIELAVEAKRNWHIPNTGDYWQALNDFLNALFEANPSLVLPSLKDND